ncbi:MAG: SCO1664 family protein [Chloroflexi bacterium]|nr:SCO1664 family protein [Chloroflexota bacterium]
MNAKGILRNEIPQNEILQLLQTGVMEMEGALPWSSNYSFLARVRGQLANQPERELMVVYKPRKGERPLWDFSIGTLCQREVAAFLISDALRWELVPPTVLRQGPHGIGSVQQFVEHDPECHYFTFEGNAAFRRALQQIVLFDTLINNADRKSGHVVIQENPGADRLWAIDHGICFHTEYKLRTVIWEFAGAPIPDDLMADLVDFKASVNQRYSELRELLSDTEILALEKRLDRIIEKGTFIKPGPGRHYPWPPI